MKRSEQGQTAEVRGQRPEVRGQCWLRRAVVVLLAAAPLAQAQYAIDWFTIDGGGGASSGGGYAVTGTIGQPDAGRMSGGDFAIEGGLWGIIAAVQTAGAPRLEVACAGGAVTVQWKRPAEGWILEFTPGLATPTIAWTTIAPPYPSDATHCRVTEPAPVGNRFYRLRKP